MMLAKVDVFETLAINDWVSLLLLRWWRRNTSFPFGPLLSVSMYAAAL